MRGAALERPLSATTDHLILPQIHTMKTGNAV